MKRYGILGMIVAILLTGCGTGVSVGSSAGTQAESAIGDRTENSTDTENQENEGEVQVTIENTVMPVELLNRLTGNLVWVEAGGYCGSGFIWSMEGDMLIVTAAHVLEDVSSGVVVRLWDGYEVSVNEHFICQNSDLAFLKIDGERIPLLHKDAYGTASFDSTALDRVQTGDGLYVMGYTGSDGVCVNEGTLLDKWIYVEDFKQHMILAQADIAHGMSGGALIDAKGYPIGIISGKNEAGEMVAVPYHVINAELLFVNWS